jgi:hypothetical protein
MSTGAKVGAGFVVGLLLGGVAGGVAGAKVGSGVVVDNWVNTNVNDTKEMVEILEQLRAKKGAEALEGCEMHLNRHLFGLTPQAREGFSLSEGALARVEEAKKLAQAYRQANPRADAKSALDKDVAAFLGAK